MRTFILTLIAAILLVILVLQNTQVTSIRIFFWSIDAPLMLMLFLVTLLGALITWLLSFPGTMRRKKEHREANRKIQVLESKMMEQPAPVPPVAIPKAPDKPLDA